MSKQKIYNIIPGEMIQDDNTMKKIEELINSIQFTDWEEINEDVYSKGILINNNEFYVMYIDPWGDIKRLFITARDQIMRFMKERINYEHGDGVDMVICNKDISNAIVCNHDGQVYELKK